MKRSIQLKKISGKNTLMKYIDRRLSCAFTRTTDAIHSLAITVRDVNGPKGGVDKECQIVLNPTGLSSIVVTERQPNTRHAIFRAIARASQSLKRKMKRKQRGLQKSFSLNAVDAGLAG